MHRDLPTAGADGRDLREHSLSLLSPYRENDGRHINSSFDKNVDCIHTLPLRDDMGARKHSDAFTGPQIAKQRGHSESTSMKSDHCNCVDDVEVARTLNCNVVDFQTQMLDEGQRALHYNDNEFPSNCMMRLTLTQLMKQN